MKIKILLLTIALTCFSCNNSDDNESELPECFQEIIDAALEAPFSNAFIATLEYSNNGGEIIYLVSLFNFPDAFSASYQTSNCEVICSGSTGISGQFQGDCPSDFFENTEFIEIVWEDPR